MSVFQLQCLAVEKHLFAKPTWENEEAKDSYINREGTCSHCPKGEKDLTVPSNPYGLGRGQLYCWSCTGFEVQRGVKAKSKVVWLCGDPACLNFHIHDLVAGESALCRRRPVPAEGDDGDDA